MYLVHNIVLFFSWRLENAIFGAGADKNRYSNFPNINRTGKYYVNHSGQCIYGQSLSPGPLAQGRSYGTADVYNSTKRPDSSVSERSKPVPHPTGV